MKRIILGLFVFLALCGFVNRQKSNPDKLDSFKWLIGSWSMKTSKGTIMETWLPMNDSSLSGESIMIKKTSEVVPMEKIRLVSRNKDFYYIPVVKGQNGDQAVEFKITQYSKTGFTAENRAHDFPKRIIYTLVKKDSIHARVDGGPSMPNKKADYYYSRLKKK